MTALRMAARREQDASLRPVPWRRMAWVTWRQHRIALAGAAALLGALAVWLWLEGLQAHRAYAAATDCHPASSGACGALVGYFLTYVSTAQTIAIVLQAVPALIGAFVGAPVLAREMETGTFRYTWTQGFGRWRWTLAKLVPLAVAVAAAAAAFSVLFSWYYQPFFDPDALLQRPGSAGSRGVRPARGRVRRVDAGRLRDRRAGRHAHPPGRHRDGRHPGRLHRARRRRRVLPARALPGAAAGQERGRALAPHGSSASSGTPRAASRSASPYSARSSQGAPQLAGGKGGGGIPQDDPTVNQYLAQHGYTLWTTYQPGSRFWPFQWIEGGWLLALSVLLIAATVWLVRRRAA